VFSQAVRSKIHQELPHESRQRPAVPRSFGFQFASQRPGNSNDNPLSTLGFRHGCLSLRGEWLTRDALASSDETVFGMIIAAKAGATYPQEHPARSLYEL
jgi:hypothetical protein